MRLERLEAPSAPRAVGVYAQALAGIFDERWLLEIEAVAAA